MAAAFLIDLTDARFSIAENADVLAYIRQANPFAHTDVGDVLFRLGDELPGAAGYCPAPRSCAYVVLHTERSRIFAIAYGMNGLAFRLPAPLLGEAVEDGGALEPKIGPDWVRFDPWPPGRLATARMRLRRWCRAAFDAASAEGDGTT